MISYNTKEWFTFIFRFHKADTFRKLGGLMLAISVYSGIIAWLELEYWQLSEVSKVKNIPLMHSLLGFAISMLLVFRTNTAYDRWWEGRKLWGALTNNSRNLALKIAALLPKEEQEHRNFFKKIIPAYAQALHNHLNKENTRLALFDVEEHGHLIKNLKEHKHVPNQLALLMHQHVHLMQQQGLINPEHLYYLNTELQTFTDVCGGCERIKNTPIPYSYSVFIKKFIFIYVMTLPFGYVFSLGYYVIPVVAFVFYVLASLELIAEEIEDPFGGDENDVPTQKIAENIHNHVWEIL